jgi:hypothetical protein
MFLSCLKNQMYPSCRTYPKNLMFLSYLMILNFRLYLTILTIRSCPKNLMFLSCPMFLSYLMCLTIPKNPKFLVFLTIR